MIATGSSPKILPQFFDLGDKLIVNDDIFEWAELPKSVAVFGSGVIGLELGQALHRLGVKVKVFGRPGRIRPITDPEIVSYAKKKFQSEFYLDSDSTIEKIWRDDDDVVIQYLTDGKRNIERFEYLLAATGRKPNIENLDLFRTSLQLDSLGVPVFDPLTMQCGNSHIFIAGDINNDLNLLHEAADEGQIAGENAAWRFINKVLPIIKTGFEITFAWLPKNRDPDQMINNSKKDFISIINSPKTLIDTIWDILEKKHDPTNPDTRALLWSEAKKTVNLINDSNLKQSYFDEVYKRISASRNNQINYSRSQKSFANHKKIKTFIGENNLLDAIFFILINNPKLALDYSEELVKIDFNNKNKNKILLILIDMIITNQDLGKMEFIDYLKEKDLIESINNLDEKLIIKWIGYNPSDKKINEIKYNFSDLLKRKLINKQRI